MHGQVEAAQFPAAGRWSSARLSRAPGRGGACCCGGETQAAARGRRQTMRLAAGLLLLAARRPLVMISHADWLHDGLKVDPKSDTDGRQPETRTTSDRPRLF